MTLDVRVDPARCIASKSCTYAAEGVFAVLDQVATVVDPAGGTDEEILDAAESCPTGAISVFRDGEQIA